MDLFESDNIRKTLFIRFFPRRKTIVAIIALIATFVDRYIIYIPLDFLEGCSAMLFYLVGYALKRYNIKPLWLLTLVPFWIISIIWSHIWMVQCNYGMFPIDVLGAVAGSTCVYYCSKYLTLTRISKFFEWVGRNSLCILCVHLIEMKTRLYNIIGLDNVLLIIVYQLTFILLGTCILTHTKYIKSIF